MIDLNMGSLQIYALFNTQSTYRLDIWADHEDLSTIYKSEQ